MERRNKILRLTTQKLTAVTEISKSQLLLLPEVVSSYSLSTLSSYSLLTSVLPKIGQVRCQINLLGLNHWRHCLGLNRPSVKTLNTQPSPQSLESETSQVRWGDGRVNRGCSHYKVACSCSFQGISLAIFKRRIGKEVKCVQMNNSFPSSSQQF